MAEAVIMPKAGITVETCIMGEWLKQPGDAVEVGEILFTYETDKAVFECESTAAGQLLGIFFYAGDEVPVLTAVCAVGSAGEAFDHLRPGGAPATAAPQADAVASQAASVEKPITAQTITETPAATAAAGSSPRARALAERAGVSIEEASPTGPAGRIIERDVRRRLEEGPGLVAPSAAAAAQDGGYEEVKLSGIRRAIAKTMAQSLQSMAQLTHHHSFDASELLRLRAQFKAQGGEYAGVTIGDMVLFAVSRTLKNYPDLNATMPDAGVLRRYKQVNLGVAVSTDRGLMVPTLYGADGKTLVQLSTEVKELAASCRSGAINPDLLKNGSFTVSNLGAYGVEIFTPVINPPQTGILGVCGTVERLRTCKDGGVKLYPAMGLSLTYDHRALDGAPASEFLRELCNNLENFAAMAAV